MRGSSTGFSKVAEYSGNVATENAVANTFNLYTVGTDSMRRRTQQLSHSHGKVWHGVLHQHHRNGLPDNKDLVGYDTSRFPHDMRANLNSKCNNQDGPNMNSGDRASNVSKHTSPKSESASSRDTMRDTLAYEHECALSHVNLLVSFSAWAELV